MENKTYNHTFKFILIFSILALLWFGTDITLKRTKSLQTQIDSLKKQDSIKELYRVYNMSPEDKAIYNYSLDILKHNLK